MKKIFYLLFICSIALASCHKHEHPIEITENQIEVVECTNCGNGSGSGSGSTSSSLDTALVGHWQATGLTSADGTTFDNDQLDLYIISDGSYVITTSVSGNMGNNFGTIREISNRKIIIDTDVSQDYAVFNYDIQNGILILSPELGTDLFWYVTYGSNNDFGSYIQSSYVEINNLTKQY